MYRPARENRDIGRDAAAFGLHIGSRTLSDYETGKTTPPPDVVLGMSRLYHNPQMVPKYCHEFCAIGQALGYEDLNAIDTNPSAVLSKLTTKIEDSETEIKFLSRLMVNKRSRDDFTTDEWLALSGSVQNLFDIEHNIAIFRMIVLGMLDIEETAHLVAAHNQKCRDRGYVRKEERPLVTAVR